jgi:hypothetical protein
MSEPTEPASPTPKPDAVGTYGQGDKSSSSQRSRSRTERPNEVAAGKVADKAGTAEAGENLKGPDAGGEAETDMGRGGD